MTKAAAVANIVAILIFLPTMGVSYNLKVPSPQLASRRGFFGTATSTASAVLSGSVLSQTLSGPAAAAAAADEADVEVYFGCGCFWHVQHEFVEAERRILGRTGDLATTAYTGYAGGTKQPAGDPKVCYHNLKQDHDYGSFGHAEVVTLKVPPSSFQAFCEMYFNLFDANGNRPDQFGDRGGEYRNLVGIPGGSANVPLYKAMLEAAVATGDRLDLSKGKGSDGDSRANVWVMDSTQFPSYVAEPYHQFHDGFAPGENYPNSYNGLAKAHLSAGLFVDSKCPSF
mmetsp:Transcript_89398/g.178664  ORF Transcript_89398/g.178664 Transcript_89398/m.178664 type:complete len:284 (-) Transcript_89398:235-1086(-)